MGVLIFSQSVWAQDQKTKDKPTAAKAQAEEAEREASEKSVAEEKSGEPSHQGIKVHGHWTIEVYNPSGSLVSVLPIIDVATSPWDQP